MQDFLGIDSAKFCQKETLIAVRQSAQKVAQLLKDQGLSEDDIIAEFNAMRKQARRDATK